MINHSLKNGWKGFLSFTFVDQAGRTVVKDKKHYGPLVLQRPYYQELTRPSILIIHPPGGVAGGDILETTVHFEENTCGLISTPAATKFYRSSGDTAYQTQTVVMSKGCELEWLPQETLFFNASKSKNKIVFKMQSPDNSLIAWDIVGLGRPHRGECFEEGLLDQRLEFYIEDELVFFDRIKLTDSSLNQHSVAGFKGHVLLATALFYCEDIRQLETLKDKLNAESWDDPVGLSLIDGVLVLRVLSHDLDDIKSILYHAWAIARPYVIGVDAVKPRIWNT